MQKYLTCGLLDNSDMDPWFQMLQPALEVVEQHLHKMHIAMAFKKKNFSIPNLLAVETQCLVDHIIVHGYAAAVEDANQFQVKQFVEHSLNCKQGDKHCSAFQLYWDSLCSKLPGILSCFPELLGW